MLNLLQANGFVITYDPAIAAYKTLDKYHRYGQCKGLEVAAEVGMHQGVDSAMFKLEFFQNINISNRNGGRYDSNKRAMMPYLVGIRFELIRNKVIAFLREQGAIDKSDPQYSKGSSALAKISHRIRTCGHFYNGDPLVDWKPDPRATYNALDRDKRLIEPGQVKYFYNHSGHLQRGTVYYSLNSQWHVVIDKHTVGYTSAHELFDWAPGTPRRRPVDRKPKLERAMTQAIKELRFERAAKLRDLLGLKAA